MENSMVHPLKKITSNAVRSFRGEDPFEAHKPALNLRHEYAHALQYITLSALEINMGSEDLDQHLEQIDECVQFLAQLFDSVKNLMTEEQLLAWQQDFYGRIQAQKSQVTH